MVDDKEIQEIINAYDTLVKGIHKKATPPAPETFEPMPSVSATLQLTV